MAERKKKLTSDLLIEIENRGGTCTVEEATILISHLTFLSNEDDISNYIKKSEEFLESTESNHLLRAMFVSIKEKRTINVFEEIRNILEKEGHSPSSETYQFYSSYLKAN